MAPDKAKRNTRSKSCGRSRGRSSSPAAGNSQHPLLPGQSNLSLPFDGTLPPEIVNNQASSHSNSSQVGKHQSSKAQIVQPDKNSTGSLNTSPSNTPELAITGSSPEVGAPLGDNTESKPGSEEEPIPSNRVLAQTLSQVLKELRDIKGQIIKLDKVEATTNAMASQLSGVVEKTAELETAVASNTTRLREVDDKITTLKGSVEKQEKFLNNTKVWKEEVLETSNKNVKRVNELVVTQQKQVDAFHENVNKIRQSILDEVDTKVDKKVKVIETSLRKESKNEIAEAKKEIQEGMFCQSLKSQAYNNKLNLVVTGLKADEQKSDRQAVSEFFTKTLGAKEVSINSVRRIGPQRDDGSGYIRPMVVQFKDMESRSQVWKKRMDITADDGSNKIRVQADIPKPLREGLQVMFRVAKAAAKIPEFASARVTDYQLEVNGKTYQISDLEKLPKQIRPSTLASPCSDTAMVFFTRHSFLSNHHMSEFKIEDQTYQSIEQYLAVCKASMAENQALIDRARKAYDPVQAKHILNLLKNAHAQEWNAQIEGTILKGLRAKFTQSQSLRDKLIRTGKLQLGEASKNPRWGIGMDLNDPDVLNQGKWLESGNLLGKSLMKIREELQPDRSRKNRK